MNNLYDNAYDVLPSGVFSVLLDRELTIKKANPWFTEHTGLSVGGSLIAAVAESDRERLELDIHRSAADITAEPAPIKLGESFFKLTPIKCDYSSDCVELLLMANDHSQQFLLESRERLRRRRYDYIAQLTDSILFYYDINSGTIYTYGTLSLRLGASVELDAFPRLMCELGIITEDSGSTLRRFLSDATNGVVEKSLIDFRFDSKNYVPAMLDGRLLKDSYDRPLDFIVTVRPVDKGASGAHFSDNPDLDALTGVFTRSALEGIIRECLVVRPDHIHTLIMLEIDGFKRLNESRGHSFGDKVLKEISALISGKLGDQDIIGRYAGAVFCVFCRSVESESYVPHLADEIKHTIDERYTVRSVGFTVRCNYGLAVYGEDGDTCEELLRRADIAMFKSKNEKNKPIKLM